MKKSPRAKLTSSDQFRLNFTSLALDPLKGRHWMLRNQATADYLKTVLRIRRPELGVPIFKDTHEFDDLLHELIVSLNLMNEPEPQCGLDEIRCSAKFLMLMIKAYLENERSRPFQRVSQADKAKDSPRR